jgi:hypothetical protein
LRAGPASQLQKTDIWVKSTAEVTHQHHTKGNPQACTVGANGSRRDCSNPRKWHISGQNTAAAAGFIDCEAIHFDLHLVLFTSWCHIWSSQSDCWPSWGGQKVRVAWNQSHQQ